ncbi:SIS domain-containing protein [Allokutzneria sp. NRRL B-24872]|uniref:SIS domain-containing protein n=1 Tax=Allokutzneria sp. NRRL B-24872 TaxID=1137961 RepID=UPI000A3A13DB|nr:SIS domain-containing protein [Allokutzneria sp. NRRL B-24872]
MLDDTLLDDPRRLQAVDGGGLLRAAAMAGAQVRATEEAATEGDIERMIGRDRPRALVLLTRPGVGPASAQLLAALLGPACPVPVVLSDVVPGWVGALDLVIAHTDDPGDRVLAESVELATRRGARMVITAPEDGPVAQAAAGRALLLPPRIPVPGALSFARVLAAGLITLSTLGLLRADLGALADELDREAERDHPMHESFVNPAKSLALRLADRTPLLWGLDHAATAVAAHGALALASFSGVVADVAGYPQAVIRPALHRAAVSATSQADIFADPDDDEGVPPRVLLLAVSQGPVADAARRAASESLRGADVIAPAEEVTGDEALRAALLAVRFDLASLYLGLAAGRLGGPGIVAPAAL